jgi:2-octaprenyl-6-methoxyphenol hydroxylase
MIWCLPAALARARREMPGAELLACIARALGPRIGPPTAVGERGVYPLVVHRLRDVCEHRLVHLGNAAQSLHPVAGQGFNLGIRDCVCLVECLVDVRALEGGDALSALNTYRARRRLDRTLVPALTSALPRIFSTSAAPVVIARSAAMVALDLVPGLRREFTRLLMLGAPR